VASTVKFLGGRNGNGVAVPAPDESEVPAEDEQEEILF